MGQKPLVGELPASEMGRPLLHPTQSQGIKEQGRPAIAQDDLVIGGRAEVVQKPLLNLLDQVLYRGLRWEVPKR